MKPSPSLLERYFSEHEFTAPYLLCCSDCESLSVGDLLKLEKNAHEELSSLWLGYTEVIGQPELRNQISSNYKKASSNDIMVHTGAEEAIFNFMNVALDPGDQIIVHSPFYQSLGEIAKSLGAHVVEWKTDPSNSWELDLGFLENAVTDKTRVVVINVPHNPTGFLPTTEFMTGLSRLSDEKGFMVFSDEVYRGLEYDPTLRLPPFADLNERAVSLGVMSKTYGLAGLRIGWIATRNKKIFKKMERFKDYTTISNSAPSEFLATLALKHRESIVERNLNIIRKNLKLLNSFFNRHKDLFEWQEPKAGPIAFPRYTGKSIEQFCNRLVENTGVLLAPGTLFENKNNHFRIGFGRANMVDCLKHLEQFIENSG